MASLAEATYQRRVFAWQGAAREPWSGTEASSAPVGWTLQKDDVLVLIEQLRNAAGAAVAFVELQVDGKRTQRRGWVDPAHLKRRAGDETDDELAVRREQLAAAAAEHLASRRWTEAYHAYAEAIAADPANHVLFSNRALCCARLHRAAPSAELRRGTTRSTYGRGRSGWSVTTHCGTVLPAATVAARSCSAATSSSRSPLYRRS